VDRGVSRGQRGGSPTVVNLSFLDRVHTPTEDKIGYVKDSFYKELERVFDKFLKFSMKILLGDFNVKVGKEDIFKPTTGNESLHNISNDNGVKVVNFATSKNLTIKSTMFLNHSIHEYAWILQVGKLRLTMILYIGKGIQVYLVFDHSGQHNILSHIPGMCGVRLITYDEGSDWIPDLFTMEIYNCTHYNY
jgi:hypothetical protein